MIIGEAPGKNEQEQGIPFIGNAGQVLNQALEEAGLPRESVFVTNIYKLRPPNNRTPTEEEMRSHAPFLLEEFEIVEPRFVLLLGNSPLGFFTWQKGITRKRGSRVFPRIMGSTFDNSIFFYCTYHPAATIYNKATKEDFFRDIKVFAEIVQGSYTTA